MVRLLTRKIFRICLAIHHGRARSDSCEHGFLGLVGKRAYARRRPDLTSYIDKVIGLNTGLEVTIDSNPYKRIRRSLSMVNFHAASARI